MVGGIIKGWLDHLQPQPQHKQEWISE